MQGVEVGPRVMVDKAGPLSEPSGLIFYMRVNHMI